MLSILLYRGKLCHSGKPYVILFKYVEINNLFVKIFLLKVLFGPVAASAGTPIASLPPPVTVWVRGGGVRDYDPCSQNFARGSPLFYEMSKIYWPVAAPARTSVTYLPPPPAPVGVHGGVRPIQPLRPKICQGFPPSLRIYNFFVWANFWLHHPARLRLNSGGIHTWVHTIWWGWGRGAHFGTTNTQGRPARITNASWQGDVL